MNMLKHLKKLKNQKGMTLVELLAVMVIVGIIAAIAIPAIGGLIENTRKDAYISNATSVQEAARLFVVSNENVIEQNGSYPVTITWTKPKASREEPDGGTTTTQPTSGWKVETGETNKQDITAAAEDFSVYVENLVDPHTKQAFEAVSVKITKEADGELKYETSLTGSKYKIKGAKDARNLTRNDIVAASTSSSGSGN